MNYNYFQDGRVSMAGKMAMVSDLFELNVINDDEALKACKVIIGQHAKVDNRSGATSDNNAKIVK